MTRLPRAVRLASLALAAAALATPERARAEFMTVNPGVTISYTVGRGFTYGLEVSLVWFPETIDAFRERPYGRGLAIDFSTDFRGFYKTRAAAEVIGPFIGLEAGPALVVDRTGAHLGIGVTPWAGYYVMPYYTYTYVFGDADNLHEWGTYFKIFLNPDGSGSGSHHHDFD